MKNNIYLEPRLRSIARFVFIGFFTVTGLFAAGPAVPVSNNASIATDKNRPVAIALMGSDADNDPLTYTVVSGPSNGALSGTSPNLTYTPTAGYNGTDSFTFKASDGTNESNTATISITVYGVRMLDYTAPTPGTVKTFKVAVLMINTLTTPMVENAVSKQLEFCSPEKLGQIFFQHEHGAASYIKEVSYGKYALEGRVVGWVDQPVAGLHSDTFVTQSDFYLSLANAYLTYSNYDIFVVYARTEAGGQQTGWLYPQQSFTTPQGTINNIGITWMINSEIFDFAPLSYSNWSSGDAVLPTTSWSHELLHTFGINGHANSYDCGTETIATTGTSNPIKGYGGCFSIMGEYAYSTHPDALMKSRIGWLTPQQIPDITSSGTYEIRPLETNDGQTKALVIPLRTPITHTQHTAQFDAFVLEYRTNTGFDRYLDRLNGSPFLSNYTTLTNIDSNGVLVTMRYSGTSTDGTVLLDMNPTTTYRADRGIKWQGNVGKFADAILPVNRTFTWDNIQITPLGTTPSGAMRVSITKSASFVAWTQRTFAKPLTDVVMDHDPDGDGVTNFIEFAFGTDPTSSNGGALATDGSAHGGSKPVTNDAGATFDLVYVRRDDHGTSGSASYTPQFSSDLVTFYDSAATPSVVADSSVDAAYEVVKVPYPQTLPNGQKAKFGRIKLSGIP